MLSKRNRIVALTLVFILTISGVFYTLKNLQFEDKFTSILPQYEQNALLNELLDSAAFFDRIIVHAYLPDSSDYSAKELVNTAEQLSDSVRKLFIPRFLQKIDGKTRSDIQNVLFSGFASNLPLYLDSTDYKYLDSLIKEDNYDKLVAEQLKLLNSPAGIMAARYVFRDPLGIISKQYLRLKDLQVEDNLSVYRNYLVSNDKKHLVFFLIPNESSKTQQNKIFIDEFDKLIAKIEGASDIPVKIEYTGALPMATANAGRIKMDVQLTLNLAILVIILLILYFYRRWQYLLLVLFPALIGAITALVFFTFFFGYISAISIGIGSVLLGISVDYALHIFTHLKHKTNVRKVISDVALPVLMSSVTTASAFLGLLALSSPALRQLGLFAAISVFASALVAVFILPLLLKTKRELPSFAGNTFIEKVANYELPDKKWNVFIIIIISIFLSFFIKKVSFEEDFERLNYMSDKLSNAEFNLDKAGNFSGKKSYLLSAGTSLDEAIDNARKGGKKLDSLKNEGVIENYHNPLSLIFSKDEQHEKIKQWNTFWSSERLASFRAGLSKSAVSQHVKPEAYAHFFNVLSKKYTIQDPDSLLGQFKEVAGSFLLKESSKEYLATVIRLPDTSRQTVSEVFSTTEGNYLVDKKVYFNNIFNNLQFEFNKLLYISLVIVFIILLIFLGRIELALVTFIPILVSWIWTLGFIGMLDIKLNFFNIVICSLIFGLGVDYSIFITRGLMQKHKTGQNHLGSFKSSILISALTTVVGLGVLLFAKHPALKSIASVAVLGIISAVVISFSLQRPLFRFLVGRPGDKRQIPVGLVRYLFTKTTFALFGLAAVVFTVLIIPVSILPLPRAKKQFIFRFLTFKCTQFLNWSNIFIRIKKVGFDKIDFQSPSIVVSNHQSMMDLIFYMSVSPHIIILTKDWVWNNPVFGIIVRMSGHLNISQGYDQLSAKIQERMDDGCSLLVFPEGSRTFNGKIKRYHKGAFYLAEQNNLPIHNMVICGMYDLLPRKAAACAKAKVEVKYLSTYQFASPDSNEYSKIAKQACAAARKALADEGEEDNTVYNYKNKIIYSFLYIGPVLEHYVKVKLKLDKNYKRFHELLPKEGKIYDMGCGYGLMSFMLKLRAPQREIVASDIDEEKVLTASNSALNSDLGIDFSVADVVKYQPENADAVILSDVLHYLTEPEQKEVLRNTVGGLKKGGILLLRDGDASKNKRHKGTQLSELFSTRLGFNKTRNQLSFFRKSDIEDFVRENNLTLEIIDETKFNSNLIYKIIK